MIYKLDNEIEFKKKIQTAWDINAENWIINRKLPKTLVNKIIEFVSQDNKSEIIDIGCGNGWIVNHLIESNLEFNNYLGIEINKTFCQYLNQNFNNEKVEFLELNFESDVSNIIGQKFNRAIAVLSFIEMIHLDIAFKNCNHILVKNGLLMIIVLNPIFELIRLNNNIDELKSDISKIRETNDLFYYEKKIIAYDKRGEKPYYGILNTLNRYLISADKNKFKLVNFFEIDAFNEFGKDSTIYNCLIFEKYE